MNFVDHSERAAGRGAVDIDDGELGRCGGGKVRLWLPPCPTTTNTLFTLLHHVLLVVLSDAHIPHIVLAVGALP